MSGAVKDPLIGDKQAFKAFREYEQRKRQRYGHGRAVNAALFADEMDGSPASDIRGAFRNVLADQSALSVGGFAAVLSDRDIGFRYSVYSDVLLDWPEALPDGQDLQLIDKYDLAASGENDQYSVSQISKGYYDVNIVAFYLLEGRLLIVNRMAASLRSIEILPDGKISCVKPSNLSMQSMAARVSSCNGREGLCWREQGRCRFSVAFEGLARHAEIGNTASAPQEVRCHRTLDTL